MTRAVAHFVMNVVASLIANNITSVIVLVFEPRAAARCRRLNLVCVNGRPFLFGGPDVRVTDGRDDMGSSTVTYLCFAKHTAVRDLLRLNYSAVAMDSDAVGAQSGLLRWLRWLAVTRGWRCCCRQQKRRQRATQQLSVRPLWVRRIGAASDVPCAILSLCHSFPRSLRRVRLRHGVHRSARVVPLGEQLLDDRDAHSLGAVPQVHQHGQCGGERTCPPPSHSHPPPAT